MSAHDEPRPRKTRRPWWKDPLWLVPLVAAAACAWVFGHRWSEEGPVVEITFTRADGLEAGKSDLKFRGVKLGDVVRLKLHHDLKHVIAEVQLERSAGAFAREGAKFWVVRPRLSATGVEALGTVVTGSYIAALPGKGEDRKEFKGLPEPPPVIAEQQGLDIVIVTESGAPLQRGAPVLYRGIKVGAAGDTELSKDARSIRTHVTIEAPYRGLVRLDSRFWNAGGIKFHFGLLHGADVSAKSLSTLIEGGLAFATPDAPGKQAEPGQEFPLNDKPKDEWLKWRPSVKIGPQTPAVEGD